MAATRKIPPDPASTSPRTLLARRLREWRTRRGFTLNQVARDFGVSETTWDRWEKGTACPLPERLVPLAQFIGIPVCHFFYTGPEECCRSPARVNGAGGENGGDSPYCNPGSQANPVAFAASRRSAEPVGRARDYISQHFSESISLAQVARTVGMSANYFSEKFKEATGVNFVEYVARTRIERARSRLQISNLRISEVAFEVGFQSLSQFNRTFKKFADQSPKKYRSALVTRSMHGS